VNYSVLITRKGQKELESVPSPHYQRIEEQLLSLSANPRPPGSKKLKGTEKHWRARVGDYRILYEIDDSSQTVTVFKIGHRSDVYR
jgi:mRNA interferase RelE/StbE